MTKWERPVALWRLAAVLTALLLSTPPVYGASGYFTVTGRVIDHAGHHLQNVKVELAGKGATFTDQDGKYAFEDVPPGDYVIRFSKAGFLSFSRYGTLRNPINALVGAELLTRQQLKDLIGPWDSTKGILIGEVRVSGDILSGTVLRTEPQVGPVSYWEEGGISETGFKKPASSGWFVVRNVIPGQYAVNLDHPILRWTTKAISVYPDEISLVQMFTDEPVN